MAENTQKYTYLDYLERPLDNQQLKVCCRTDNSVVAAGAGSGKTQVLASRFAWLCMEFDDISASSILTLTFTKKAASEMYLRIYETLNRFASAPEDKVPQHQRKNAKRALEDFANVHIQTLDSYCGTIVRQAANRYGIRPDFTTGQSDSDIKKQALTFILSNLDNIGVQHFAQAGKIQEFAEDVFAKIVINHSSLATEKGFFSKKIPLQQKELVNAWNQIITDKSQEGFSSLFNIYLNAFLDENRKTELFKKNIDVYSKVYQALESDSIPEFRTFTHDDFFGAGKEQTISYIQSFLNWLKAITTYNANNISKGLFGEDFQFLREIKKLFAEKSDIEMNFYNRIQLILNFIEDFESIQSLFELLDEFTERINRSKRISGQLTFKDVTEMALKVLIEQEDIRSQEKAAYKKIMIDEFQDNNSKNRDLLFLLSEKNDISTSFEGSEDNPDAVHQLLKDKIVKDKLFFVGDEKQSIYKFRGAEVSVFNELKEDLREINGPESSLHMIYNYRSTPELLSSFNQIFGKWVPTKEGDYTESQDKFGIFENAKTEQTPFYEALYTKDAIAKYVDKEHKEMPGVILTKDNLASSLSLFISDSESDTLVKKGEILDKENQVAYSVAKKIRELADSGVKYSKIAILDKSRTGRGILKSWLERLEIPYILDQQSNIFSDGPVNDIYNFLRLCIYPQDLKAMASYLTSPFVALNVNTVLRLMTVCKSLDSQAIEQVSKEFGSDSPVVKAFSRAVAFYEEQKNLTLSRPVTDTLNVLWYDQGYHYETMLNSTVNIFAEQYDFLFELARIADSDGKSVSWFIDQLAAEKNNSDSDMDITQVSYPLEEQDAVQIMTIHKSKGLQFDHVFVTGCLTKPKPDREEQYFYDEIFGLSVRPAKDKKNYFYAIQKEEAKNKNNAEFRRLIYVALTRAVKTFCIAGNITITPDKENGGLKVNDSKDAYLIDVLKSYYTLDELLSADYGKLYKDDVPLYVEKIEPVSPAILTEYSQKTDLDALRKKEIASMTDFIENSTDLKIIETPVLSSNRITPSGLEETDGGEGAEIEAGKKCLYPRLDALVSKTENQEGLGFDELGTIVHKYLEYFIQNKPLDFLLENDVRLLSKLTKTEQDELDSICRTICTDFAASEYGQKAINAVKEGRKCRAEYAFKMMEGDLLVTGTIDLFYQNPDGSYTIVDYKTDHSIVPQKYKKQQDSYKNALCELENVGPEKVKQILYYVRYNQAVEL
ncbi:MAG: UvrD-helicase domain-containing protein [Treponema sp.]|nr:UvrD-helicase domain-containing protein [Treponema sp.]